MFLFTLDNYQVWRERVFVRIFVILCRDLSVCCCWWWWWVFFCCCLFVCFVCFHLPANFTQHPPILHLQQKEEEKRPAMHLILYSCKELTVSVRPCSYAKVSVSSHQLCKGLYVLRPTMQRAQCPQTNYAKSSMSSDQLCKGLHVLRPTMQRSPCPHTSYTKVSVSLRPDMQGSPCPQTNYEKVFVSLRPNCVKVSCAKVSESL